MTSHSLPSFFSPITKLRRSLTFNTLSNMTLRLALVIVLISGISYWHQTSQLATDTQAKLLGYITERGQREESVFLLAEENHSLLRQEFLKKFPAQSPKDSQKHFKSEFSQWSDQTYRNAAEGTLTKDFDTRHHPTSFVQPNVELNADFTTRLMLSQELVEQYGLGWQTSFIDTYISLPEGAAAMFWPGAGWGINASKDLDITNEAWAALGNVDNNPERKTLWTGIYADPVTQDWMVSAETPIDDANGRHLGTIGHDIDLNDLMTRVIDDHLEGAYNVLMSADGELIADIRLKDRLATEAKQVTAEASDDPHLQRIFDFAQGISQEDDVIYNPTDAEYLAISRLEGPGWYLVTVYPRKLLQAQAFSNTRFLLSLGLASLTLEILLFFVVLRRQIARPLKALLGATQQITAGELEDIALDTDRQDELGQLATAFTKMASQLQTAFDKLEQKIVEQKQAEYMLVEKTYALKDALQNVQQMQLQTVQNEKMSALGGLVAGVAHEINNPVGCILGNVGATQGYINDLLGLLDMYAEELSQPSQDLEEELEAVDLEYVREDLPKLIRAMEDSGDRIRAISKSLRTFSRTDTDHKHLFDIHEGIDSTVLILRHRLKANEFRPAIAIVRKYGDLPKVECFAGQLNQVFMNILANAIDVFDEMAQINPTVFEEKPPAITLQTTVTEPSTVEISIRDNGKGMADEIKAKVFDYLFTTKAIGKGTGLGLAIARQIVEEKHDGLLAVQSAIDVGTEFYIQLPLEGEL